jgi:hypothetical protein
MKHIIIFTALIFGAMLSGQAQQTTSGEQLADRLAQRLKDSLQLTQSQKDQLYAVNMQLLYQKKGVWQQHQHNDSLIQVNLQRVENTRDTLYHPILTPEQYQLYRSKKRYLMRNN